MGYSFHSVCGTKIQLSNENRVAERLLPKSDFTNGLTFSHKILDTNSIFEIRLDKNVELWSGSIELGVTTLNPDNLSQQPLPDNVIELGGETWLWSSRTITKDAESIVENYGLDLENLVEGDTVGLCRTIAGGLVYFVNGASQGVAVEFIPGDVYVICNLFGNCIRVAIVDVEFSEQRMNTIELHIVSEEFSQPPPSPIPTEIFGDINNESDGSSGPIVKLSNGNKEADQKGPTEEFNNTVVLTYHRPLRDSESLDRPKVSGVLPKESGNLHVFVNGEDQAPAAIGGVDPYGPAAQVTILQQNNLNCGALSKRALKDNESFEVEIERMVDRCIETGMTAIRPEDLLLTDMDDETYMFSGASVDEVRHCPSISSTLEEDVLSSMMSRRSEKTKVYSGRPSQCEQVPTLFDLCSQVLHKKVNDFEYTVSIPSDVLEDVFNKATLEGLVEIERANPHLIGLLDNVWKKHCRQNFRGKTPAALETWRDFYYRCSVEQYTRFETVTKKIKSKSEKATSGRTTKFAHVETSTDPNPPKPIQQSEKKSKKHRRKGKKGSGTGQNHDASASLDGSGNSNNDNIVTEATSTFRGIPPMDPVPSTSSSRKTPASKKSRKAPLMQKALKSMKVLMHR